MDTVDSDLLRRILVQIRNQRKNLNSPYLSEDDVERFHEQLDRLRDAGLEIEEFRVNEARDLYRRVTSTNTLTNQSTYASKQSVYPGVLEAKMDAILDYFDLSANGTEVKYLGSFAG